MSEGGYKIRNKEGIHFITFAVVDWVDVFTRQAYRDILLDSIRHCQKEKGLLVHAWCIMSNHVHLVVSAINNDTSDILRDFKKFTSKQIIKTITENEQESRREWMIDLFKKAGSVNSRNSTYQFWQQDNQPKELFSEKFTNQKLDYVHNNPVEAGIVEKAEEYLYSSATDYYFGKQCGLLEIDFLY
jgi:REP element-mobilizing transposase RayT